MCSYDGAHVLKLPDELGNCDQNEIITFDDGLANAAPGSIGDHWLSIAADADR